MSQRKRRASSDPPTQHHALTPAQAAGARKRARAALLEALSAAERDGVEALLSEMDEVDARIEYCPDEAEMEVHHTIRMHALGRADGEAHWTALLQERLDDATALQERKRALVRAADALLEAKLPPGTPANEYGWALHELRRRRAEKESALGR